MIFAYVSIRRTLALGGIALAAVATSVFAQNSAPTPTDTAAAVDVVRRYYRAIDARDYATAWAQWGSRGRPGQTYASFRRGFAATRAVQLSVTGPARTEGAAGSEYVTIPVRIDALSRGGRHQHFGGEYVVRRTNIDGATADQRRWHLYSATLKAR